ncbi:MAG: hypothetical protein J7K34_07890 [Flavobacteriaceae bacterium]|nr:hypothetical protein [Flavobacteriaceae bacterium]
MKKNYLLFVILTSLIFFIFSCNSTDNKRNTTFFGGKIKNPKGPFVYLYEGKKIIDSAKIDEHSKFTFLLDSIKLGLYTFKHGSEYQYLYLEPKDSLLIYLNTWDFDESLIFSGKGSAKNNYLINLYLQQEKNEKEFKYNYSLNEKEFSKLIDEGIRKQFATYNDLLIEEDGELFPFFDKLVKTGIYFPFYLFKEFYPFNHKSVARLKEFPELSKDFYSYRKNIDFNDEDLLYYAPYTSYIRIYLYNMAYSEKAENPKNNNVELNFMKIVNEKIKIESLRNEFLAGSLWNSLSNDWIPKKDFREIKDFYYMNCTNEEFNNEIKRAIYQKNKLQKGDTLPNLLALNSYGNEIKINNLAKNSNTVIYFWPTDPGKISLTKEKLLHLKKKYPNILFIGIERNKNNEVWKNFISSKKLSSNAQFYLSKNSETYGMFSGDMARAIVIDKNGYIKSSFSFFDDKYFEKHLKNLKY